MIRRISFLTLVAGAILSGCSKSTETPSTVSGDTKAAATDQPANIASDDPRVVVGAFLDAIRTGNEDKALNLLTKVARQKTLETDRSITSNAYDTARIEVGAVEKVGDDGARVTCTCTVTDKAGKPDTESAIWLCRHEPEGWRVCGYAPVVFKGEDPLLLNFEDPADMERHQKWLQEEVLRREKAQNTPPQNAASPMEAEKKPQDAFRR